MQESATEIYCNVIGWIDVIEFLTSLLESHVVAMEIWELCLESGRMFLDKFLANFRLVIRRGFYRTQVYVG